MSNVYIDFEANGISQIQEIISIGAVKETGESFYSLVKPHAKLDHIIKENTHISQEEADIAPTIEEVMEQFEHWLGDMEYDFIVYGGSDKDFINCSMTLTYNEQAITMLKKIIDNMVRVDLQIAKKFRRKTIKLRSAYLTMRLSSNESIEQHHNALEDAEMLKYVWENLDEYSFPEDATPVFVPTVRWSYGKKKNKKKQVVKSKKPSRFNSKRAYRRWKKKCIAQCPEILDEKFNFKIKATRGNKKPIFHDNLRQALHLVAPCGGFKDGFEKLDGLNKIYDAIQKKEKINGWLLERIEEEQYV